MRSKTVKKIGCAAMSAIMIASMAACGVTTVNTDSSVDADQPVTTIITVDGVDKLQVNDFYLYANEDWMSAVDMPAYEYYVDRNETALDNLYEQIVDMFEASKPEDYAEDDPMRKMTEFYNQCADEEQRTVVAMAQIKEMTDHVIKVKNVSELQALMNDREYSLFNDICGIILVQTSSLNFLPEYMPKSMYDLRYDLTEEQRTIINQGIAKEFTVLGYSEEEAQRIADNACAFDELIHDFYNSLQNVTLYATDEEAYKDVDCTVNLMEILKANDYYFTDMINQTEYVCFIYDEYIDWLNANVNNANIEMVRDFYAYSIVNALYAYGSNELIAENAAIMQQLCGAERLNAEDADGYDEPIAQVVMYDQGAIAAEYTSRYVTDDMRAEISEMTTEIVKSYMEMVADIEWLDTPQRERLKNKAGLITYQLGSFIDYNQLEDMEIGESVIDSVISLLGSNRRFGQRMLVEHMNQQENIYTDTSNISLYQHNAYFNRESNSIIICLGYFGDDYLWNEANYEEKMAYLGAVIAHEMGHTYDPSNIGFKKSAEYDDRWDSYWENYNYTSFKVYEYYDGMETEFGEAISGGAVWYEGYSDLIAMQAVMRTLEKHDNIDYDLFFRSYAMKWGSVSREEYDRLIWAQDGHVTNHERVNSVLAQCDKFYEVYEISKDNKYYVAPENRIKIWEYAE